MSVVHFIINKKTYYADYVSERPEKADLKEGTFVYDLQENLNGEIAYVVSAAYRRRVGSIITDRPIPLNEKRRALITEIIFHEQLPDEQENDGPDDHLNEQHEFESTCY